MKTLSAFLSLHFPLPWVFFFLHSYNPKKATLIFLNLLKNVLPELKPNFSPEQIFTVGL